MARQMFVNLAANGPGNWLNGEQKHCQRIYDTTTKPEPAASAKSSAAIVISTILPSFCLETQRRSVLRVRGTDSYMIARDPTVASLGCTIMDPMRLFICRNV